MAEPKRHRDVLERVLGGVNHAALFLSQQAKMLECFVNSRHFITLSPKIRSFYSVLILRS